MTSIPPDQSDAWDIATRWCATKGDRWSLNGQLGVGGTAPVFELDTPDGLRALKLYDEEFSSGKMGEIEHTRIEQQLQLKDHDCSSLVQVYDGGTFENRLFLIMSRAPGIELEKNLHQIPRSKSDQSSATLLAPVYFFTSADFAIVILRQPMYLFLKTLVMLPSSIFLFCEPFTTLLASDRTMTANSQSWLPLVILPPNIFFD